MMGWSPSSGNPNKRRRQDVGNQQEDDHSGGNTGRRYATRLVEPRGLVDRSFDQQMLHSNMNHLLSNPSTRNLRILPLPNLSGSASEPFSNSILSSAHQQAVGNYRDAWPFSGQAGLLGQGLWVNEAVQAQLQAQAQLQVQLQARSQGRSLASVLSPTQRELELVGQGSLAFPSFAAAQQLPNLSIRVGAPASIEASLAIAPATRTTSSERNLNRKRSASFAKEEPGSVTSAVSNDKLTGRPPVVLYMPCDDAVISRYQCLARKQMELFEAQDIDVQAGAQGRNRGIVLGQVGIRCIHCSHLYPRRRTKSSTFYPSKLKSMYQTAQNMANTHLTSTCQYIAKEIRDELIKLSQDKKTSAGGGKEYWSDGARILGVYETESYLRFNPHTDYPGAKKTPGESKLAS